MCQKFNQFSCIDCVYFSFSKKLGDAQARAKGKVEVVIVIEHQPWWWINSEFLTGDIESQRYQSLALREPVTDNVMVFEIIGMLRDAGGFQVDAGGHHRTTENWPDSASDHIHFQSVCETDACIETTSNNIYWSIIGCEFHHDIRIVPDEGSQSRQDADLSCQPRQVNSQIAGGALLDSPNQVKRISDIDEGSVGILQKEAASLSQPDTATGALEEPCSEKVFNLSDFLRHRGWRYTKTAGRSSETASRCDHTKRRQKRKKVGPHR
ncbi:hypothetical protein FHW16_002888 [Phyllobacterium myrsinacearum]|uniref:Uncharacterized protein n=1 Tax=Phyllobacterium myrsinacearum TaxID=28101 RepID=A0A839ERE0_9HYPH|nr:hypothetical protein [Phyllobacterium myrsinacearum]MBA8879170.1 hypothetical protein [Phyllobacterium myrsinacearum]